jgi:hypothetical protein
MDSIASTTYAKYRIIIQSRHKSSLLVLGKHTTKVNNLHVGMSVRLLNLSGGDKLYVFVTLLIYTPSAISKIYIKNLW